MATTITITLALAATLALNAYFLLNPYGRTDRP